MKEITNQIFQKMFSSGVRCGKKSFCGILGLRMCRASLFLWFTKKKNGRRARASKTPSVPLFGQRSNIGTPADGPASPRDAARATSPPRTRARRPRSRTRARRPPRPSQALVALRRQGRAVASSAPRPSAHPLSPLRGNVAERPWRFRGITCSGCSRARQAWAAGRSAADSSPWAPRRSRTSPGTSRCHVRARRAPPPP